MNFIKMHGAGNDYIYVDGMKYQIPDESAAAKKLSDRHFSVGGDGLIIIKKGSVADYEMVMYNADGSRGAMCGNGIRCVAKYLFDEGYTNNEKEFTIESMGAIKHIKVNVIDGKAVSARVDMGKPILKASDIPVNFNGEKCVNQPVTFADREFNMTCVSMGNPHAVMFIDEHPSEFNLNKYGNIAEQDTSLFPDRVNAEFAKVIDRNNIEMRVYERGAGETLACGTGACATAVSAILNGYCDNKVTVHLLGGDLLIEWSSNENDSVIMTGPAEYAFTGTVEI
ncbi:diaminopimelate epimerase [Eubacterium sp.]|uniref:diaminopimelate epimerase n=1 Tax=Eubacterium sp. TaxID=142586 RepID=UPI0025C1E273|nr:diaminopimelate epimerase [Eubacterium sp.]